MLIMLFVPIKFFFLHSDLPGENGIWKLIAGSNAALSLQTHFIHEDLICIQRIEPFQQFRTCFVVFYSCIRTFHWGSYFYTPFNKSSIWVLACFVSCSAGWCDSSLRILTLHSPLYYVSLLDVFVYVFFVVFFLL